MHALISVAGINCICANLNAGCCALMLKRVCSGVGRCRGHLIPSIHQWKHWQAQGKCQLEVTIATDFLKHVLMVSILF